MLHSDQGAKLTNKLVASLCDHLEIHQTQTTAYHPQGNGQVDRFYCTLDKTVQENQRAIAWFTVQPFIKQLAISHFMSCLGAPYCYL